VDGLNLQHFDKVYNIKKFMVGRISSSEIVDGVMETENGAMLYSREDNG
jgi:hypothetical protein